MLQISVRTDNPEAEIGLYDNDHKIAELKWQAHRELSSTIHKKIEQLIQTRQKDWQDIGGIVLFAGPGSFTGLRIGASVANALAAGLGVPIVGTTGDSWANHGINLLIQGKNHNLVLPSYGSEPHITTPKR